jgi:hypothetical protein
MSVAIFIVLPHILGIYGKPICWSTLDDGRRLWLDLSSL